MSTEIPIYINVRDRVNDLQTLVEWLENAGHQRIILFDNASTYPLLLEYLQNTPHNVIRSPYNFGSRSLWASGSVPNEPFVYTDPDLLPIPDCPENAVGHLWELHERHPEVPKVGLGLYLDDVPNTVQSLQWEKMLVSPRREIDPGVFDSLVDTTFALYPANAPGIFPHRGLRTGFPYQVRHMPWYRLDKPNAEERYYLRNAIKGPTGSSWAEGRQ